MVKSDIELLVSTYFNRMITKYLTPIPRWSIFWCLANGSLEALLVALDRISEGFRLGRGKARVLPMTESCGMIRIHDSGRDLWKYI